MTSGSATSALLMTMTSLTSVASTSARTARTAEIWPSGSGCDPSTTCSSRSASADLLERGAERLDELVRQRADEARPCRRACTARPSGGLGPADGRVERREQLVLDEDAGAGEPVEDARTCPRWCSRRSRRSARRSPCGCRAWCRGWSSCSAISRLSLAMRVLIRRRSSSILVSPGPREPMPWPPAAWPPAWRDIDSPQPRRRGRRYCSWASSTCALPSRLLACWAKMSRISAVRSMTLTLTTSSSARRWLGAELAVADDGVGALGDDDVAQLDRPCPCPR